MKINLKRGDYAIIHLLDHAEDCALAPIIAFGRVAHADRERILLDNWVDPKEITEPGTTDRNITRYAISRADVTKIVRVREPEVWEKSR